MRNTFKPSVSILSCLIVSLWLCANVKAQAYGPTDFLIADYGGNRIAVYDSNLVFRHYLSASLTRVGGLDFLPNGNLVAVGANQQVKQISPAGVVVTSFTDARLGFPFEIKVGPSNLLYTCGQTGLPDLSEFGLRGDFYRTIGTSGCNGLAILPGGVVWAGHQNRGPIDVYNISTGALITSIPLDHGQQEARNLAYSASTDTVLIADGITGRIFERQPSGTFVRDFTPPPGGFPNVFGVTRGPGGDVFATYYPNQVVVRWRPDGTLVGSTNVSGSASTPQNIVWAGNTRIRPVPSDFDGDYKTDRAFWRPPAGWHIPINPALGLLVDHYVSPWGNPGDIPVPGDYDGDLITDLAVWRPGDNWYIVNSRDSSVTTRSWGNPGDVPVPGDYDGDNRTDIAVWRPSDGSWYILRSSTGVPLIRGWGTFGDKPVPADYDGDGKTDIAVWRPSTGNWHIVTSATGGALPPIPWGISADKPVPADYDGDGIAELAVWRPSNGVWYFRKVSGDFLIPILWGLSTDVPVPGDYDGDNKTDVAVWRPSDGFWHVIRSTNGSVSSVSFGLGGDTPIPNAYLPR